MASRVLCTILLLSLGRTALAAAKYKQSVEESVDASQVTHTIYVPEPGTTVAVQKHDNLPLLVYNCDQMPLICENVAAWSQAKHGSTTLPGNQRFHYDPDSKRRTTRNTEVCGKFDHDCCADAKINNQNVKDIAAKALANGRGSLSQSDRDVLERESKRLFDEKAKEALKETPPKVLVPPADFLPGRIWAEGVGFTCDEFPAESWVEGGQGANTVCALQSWGVFNGKDGGHWRSLSKGKRMEQDFQSTGHAHLSDYFRRLSDKDVFPFEFTTTNGVDAITKAFVNFPPPGKNTKYEYKTMANGQVRHARVTSVHQSDTFTKLVTKRWIDDIAKPTPIVPEVHPRVTKREEYPGKILTSKVYRRASEPMVTVAPDLAKRQDPPPEGPVTDAPPSTVITQTIDGVEEVATYVGSYFPEHSGLVGDSDLLTTTTSTKVENGVEVAVPVAIVVGAGGVAWWFLGGSPKVGPPEPPEPGPWTSTEEPEQPEETTTQEPEPTTITETLTPQCSLSEETIDEGAAVLPPEEAETQEEYSPLSEHEEEYPPQFGVVECAKQEPLNYGKSGEIISKIEEFCRNVKGRKVEILNAQHQEFSLNANAGVGLNLIILQNLDRSCESQDGGYEIREDECTFFYHTLVDECDKGSDDKSGGTIHNGCLSYGIQVGSKYEEPSCYSQQNDEQQHWFVHRDKAEGYIKEFCQKHKGNDITEGNGLEDYYYTYENGVRVRLRASWNKGCMNPPVPQPKVDEANCVSALQGAVLDSCQTDTREFKRGGRLVEKATCVTWEVWPHSNEDLDCGYSGVVEGNKKTTMDRGEILGDIEDFCNDDDSQLTPADWDESGFIQFPKYQGGNLHHGSNKYTVIIGYLPECTGDQRLSYYMKGNEDNCKRIFGRTIDHCETDRDNHKSGGRVIIDKCAYFATYAQDVS